MDRRVGPPWQSFLVVQCVFGLSNVSIVSDVMVQLMSVVIVAVFLVVQRGGLDWWSSLVVQRVCPSWQFFLVVQRSGKAWDISMLLYSGLDFVILISIP